MALVTYSNSYIIKYVKCWLVVFCKDTLLLFSSQSFSLLYKCLEEYKKKKNHESPVVLLRKKTLKCIDGISVLHNVVNIVMASVI